MFRAKDRVLTTRDIKAGLSEDGPKICEAGRYGVVLSVDAKEPDGVHVELQNGIKWWFKPNQLEVISE